jgi:hypothetical protein
VDLHRQAHFGLEPAHQVVGRAWREEAGHVLDAQGIRPQRGQFLPHLDEGLQAVDGASGVADGRLDVRPDLLGHLHGPAHVAHVVQGVKDAEDVNAVGVGPPHEALHDVVRVVAVAHHILPPQEHLEAGAGHGLPQAAEALPGVLIQEAHGGVKGRAAPHLHRPEPHPVQFLGDGQHVLQAHPRRQE